MEHHLARNMIRRSKRHLNMNELFLSPSLHHIHHRKQARLIKPEALNQNRSISPSRVHQRLQTKSIYSSSYTSLNSYLKEFNLSEKDFFELRQALKTIFYYIKPKTICNHKQLIKQRLTSPYLQQEQSFLPLYTNEYFIRNGLLNHNDGPDFQCYSNRSKPFLHLQSSVPSCYSSSPTPSSSMMLASSANISLPLALLSNQKYLFSARTGNFVSETSRRSQSSMELNTIKYHEKNCDEDETESMVIRRCKVQTWERENFLQQKMSIACSSMQQDEQFQTSQYHRCSTIQTPSTSKDDRTMKITEESSVSKNISLRTVNKEEGNRKLFEMKNTDDLFPMVKILAPYIIIRDSFRLNTNNNRSNSIVSTNIDSRNNAVRHDITSEKRSLTNVINPTLITTQHRSLLSSPSSPINQTHQINKDEQVQQQKKNYLLAEFESVLTQISKKHFL